MKDYGSNNKNNKNKKRNYDIFYAASHIEEIDNLNILKDLYNCFPKKTEIGLKYARMLCNEDRFQEAEKVTKQVINIDDSNRYKAHSLLSNIYKTTGCLDKAEETLTFLTKKNNAAAYRDLAEIKILKKEYKEARENLNIALEIRNNLNEKNDFIKNSIISNLGFLDLKEKKYEDAYLKFDQIVGKQNPDENDTIARTLLYLSKKLNIINMKLDQKLFTHSYILSQETSYKKSDALRHIKLHSYENSDNSNSKFARHINIDELYDYARNNLNEETYLRSYLEDHYILPYEFVGKNGENYVKVITVKDTKDIITMYPVKYMYDGVVNYEKGSIRTRK